MQYQSTCLTALASAMLVFLSTGCELAAHAPNAPILPRAPDEVAKEADGIAMPSPSSVTAAEPGGDASDKEGAALARLASTIDRGYRTDLEIGGNPRRSSFVDPKAWRRVRIFGTPTRASFRYGDAAYALSAVTYRRAEGANDTRACLAAFMKTADDLATSYDVAYDVSPPFDREVTDGDAKKSISIVLAEGKVRSAFVDNDYVAAIVAYPSFAGTCLDPVVRRDLDASPRSGAQGPRYVGERRRALPRVVA